MESPSASYGYAHRWLIWAVAAAILAAGTALRFDHLRGPYGQPDEPIANYVVSQVLTRPGLDTNWAHTQLRGEDGAAQYNFSSYYMALSALERLREFVGLRPSNEGFEAQTVFFRGCSASFGSLAMALAMLLAHRLGGWLLALGSGLWIAVNPLLVQDSHYARPEAFLTFVTVALVWMAFPRTATGWWRPWLAGVLFGLVLACKVTLALWFWLPFLACYPGTAAGRPVRLGLAALGALVGFVLGAPRVVLDPAGYLAGVRFLKNQYAGSFNFYSHDSGGPVFDFVGRYLVATAGWAVVCLFAVGLATALGKRQWSRLLALYLPTLAIAGFMGCQHTFFERNLSHAMPLLLLGAGLGLEGLVERKPLRDWPLVSFLALAAGAAFTPAEVTGRMVFEGFSGRFERRRVADLSAALSRLAAAPLGASHLVRGYSDQDPGFQPSAIRGSGPFVVLWQDVNPEITRASLRRLHARLYFEERAVFPGLFDDLPGPNTLRDYLGRTVRVLVFGVPGPSSPDAGPGANANK